MRDLTLHSRRRVPANSFRDTTSDCLLALDTQSSILHVRHTACVSYVPQGLHSCARALNNSMHEWNEGDA